MGTQEAQDSELSKASVVDFGTKARFPLLSRHVLGELEWIVKVERDRVRDAIRSSGEVREVTRNTTSHVVLVCRGGKLTPELKECNQAEDLPLGIVRDCVPKGRRVGFGGEGISVQFHRPWELNSVSMDNVSDESKHGNATMLDFSVTKETNGGLVGGSPKGGLSEVQRIIKANNRVEFLGQNLKISLGLTDSNSGARGLGGGGEGSGRGRKGKDGGSNLHVYCGLLIM